MKVMVSVASKHGATMQIADRIALVLRRRLSKQDPSAEVMVRRAQEAGPLDDFDAFVLGSAVYMGHWLEPARDLVQRNSRKLEGRPVWLFSSGPIGDPPRPAEEHAVDVGELISAARAREHRLFAGKLDRAGLGFAERAMATALRVPDGDFRDWTAIEEWAETIADALP